MNSNSYRTFTFILALCVSGIQAQEFISIQPGAEEGKDAYLRSLDQENYGDHIDIAAHAWTNSGSTIIVRSLLEFDLTIIPANAIIDSALLSLFSYNSPANGPHSTLSGSNEATLSRITSSWEEHSVHWMNQPETSTENQIVLASSSTDIQHYLNIDVTAMLQDMHGDPDNSHGFQFKLSTEEYYRRMNFASSDNPDSSLRPKLDIFYSLPTVSIEEVPFNSSELKVYPNPSTDLLRIELGKLNLNSGTIEIINSLGQQVWILNNPSIKNYAIDVSSMNTGVYTIKLINEALHLERKFIIEH